MKSNRSSRLLLMVLCAVLVTILFPVTASADMGPKPSVRVYFENMDGVLCYGTLLSETESTAGPWDAWNADAQLAHYKENPEVSSASLYYEIWKAFVDYEDTDGYYFLQEGWTVSDTQGIEWTYGPPNRFKILLYFPDTDTFVVSGIYERYAFDTYYTVDMAGVDPTSVAYGEEAIFARRSYDYGGEIASFFARVLITIALEIAIARIFKFTQKKQLLLLIWVNGTTQILLNVLLNVFNYKSGPWAFIAGYVLLEMVVFVVEAVVYCSWMRKASDQPGKKRTYVAYALVSNAVSFFAGMVIARMLPGVF